MTSQQTPPSASAAAAPIHIETNGFLLRSLTPTDVNDRFLRWLNDADMLRGLNLPALNFTQEQLAAFIASFNNYHNYFVGIFDKTNSVLLGFYTLDVNRTHKVGIITTGIGEPEYLGKNVLWLTIDALLDHFYTYRDVEKISARILAKNKRMLFNFVNNTRFVFEAKLKRECLSPDGERVDLLVFASFKNP